MTNFLRSHKKQLLLVVVLALLLVTLTSCRFDATTWYQKPYTTYGQEWVDLWNDGKGFWTALFAWPINILSFPIAWLCSTIGNALGHSYFWGIFFTTLIVRTVAWPIYSKQNGMSLKMSLLQPEMAKIQRKYGQRKDAQGQQMMQAEMMKLYKKYKINPIGCFGTMILQFPIFMSMYEVVQRINKTTYAVVDGATSISYAGQYALANTKLFNFFEINTSVFAAPEVKDKIFGIVIALLFGAIQILSQKLGQRPPKYQKKYPNAKTQESQQQKTMKTMMIVMNVVFVFMALQSTSLAIYWLIGAIYQLFQSQVGRWINERQYYKLQEKNKFE